MGRRIYLPPFRKKKTESTFRTGAASPWNALTYIPSLFSAGNDNLFYLCSNIMIKRVTAL